MYVGWIPNVSGFLSFSHLGGIKIKNRILKEEVIPPNRFLHQTTHISVLQERNLSDRPTIGMFTRTTSLGHLQFLLQAEKSEINNKRTLKGLIFCAPIRQKRILCNLHEAMNGYIENKASGNNPNFSDQEHYTAYALEVVKNNPDNALCFAISFVLHEDGIIKIEPLLNTSAENECGPLLAFEAYSFIKDIFHQHRFHNPADDSLLDLHVCKYEEADIWSIQIARSLHRSVISSFRSTSPAAHADGLGKLSYLESFLHILQGRKVDLSSIFSTNSLRSALDTHQGRILIERNDRSLLVAYGLAMAAIAVPVLFISIQLLQIPCIEGINWSDSCGKRIFRVPLLIVSITENVLFYLDWLVVATILGFAGIYLYSRRRLLIEYNSTFLNKGGWASDLRDLILRLAISYPRIVQSLLSLVVVALAAGTLYFIKRWLS